MNDATIMKIFETTADLSNCICKFLSGHFPDFFIKASSIAEFHHQIRNISPTVKMFCFKDIGMIKRLHPCIFIRQVVNTVFIKIRINLQCDDSLSSVVSGFPYIGKASNPNELFQDVSLMKHVSGLKFMY